jgi:endonuclease/exonuclease/phosphatase family metal-dependent hydrolase
LNDFDSTPSPRPCQKGGVSTRLLAIVASTLAIAACRGSADDPAQTATGDGGAIDGAGGSAGAGVGGDGGQGGGGAGAPAANEASILTWNVESFPLTPTAVAGAAAVLTDLAPDVVALQEIEDEQAFDDLLAALPDYDGVLNDDPGAFIRVGLVYRRDRVALAEVDTLFPSDWYAFPRPPLKAHVTVDAVTPIDFTIVVLHLKAQLDDESEARRRRACEVLDGWVRDRLAAGDEQDFVLLGDLNDKLTDPPEWNVFLPFLDHPELYRFLTLPLAEAGDHSYIPFESMIDHVLVTADMNAEIGGGETEVLPLEQSVGNYDDITDHRPVRTRLSWR